LLILATIFVALEFGKNVWALLEHVADLIVLFVLAWLISFILEPTVAALNRIPRLSRTAAVLVLYLGVLVALVTGAVGLLPALATQSRSAAAELPALADQIAALVESATGFLGARGLPVGISGEQLLRPIESLGPTLMGNAFSIATGAASVLVQTLLVVILSLYFMLDGDRIGHALRGAVPLRYQTDFIYFVSSVYRAFGGFLRGQIIQAVIYALGVAAILLALGFPFVALASVAAGLGMFIPFLGPVLGIVPPLAVALATDPGRWWQVLAPAMILNLAVVNVVAPKVMSQQIGLHPIVVLAAVLLGARIAGPWGALFGVPVAAVIAAMVAFYQLTSSQRRQRVLQVAPSAQAAATAEGIIGEPPAGSVAPVDRGQTGPGAATG
jgi:predicted PurR-regulated permease PerM